MKAALTQEIVNLKRENSLMVTAWYDLTARLQSNNVVLQRKADLGRSWINKQRQAVNPMGRR
jgi:protein HOOK3